MEFNLNYTRVNLASGQLAIVDHTRRTCYQSFTANMFKACACLLLTIQHVISFAMHVASGLVVFTIINVTIAKLDESKHRKYFTAQICQLNSCYVCTTNLQSSSGTKQLARAVDWALLRSSLFNYLHLFMKSAMK